MSEQDPKLSYNATLFRVRVEFTKAATLASPKPPGDLIRRALGKMDSVKASGAIAHFISYQDLLVDCWGKLRDEESAPPQTKLGLYLMAGVPDYPWLEVTPSRQENTTGVISINAPKATLESIRPEVFETAVVERMRRVGCLEDPNPAQVAGAFARALHGEPVKNLPLSPRPAQATTAANDRPFSVIANKGRREVVVVVRNVRAMRDKAQRETMFQLINQAIAQMNKACPGYEFKLLKQEFLASLQQALVGPEYLGVDLPLALLAGFGVPQKPSSASTKPKAIVANYPGAGRLTVRISDDKMEATVADFDLSWYDDPSFEVSTEWIDLELKRLGLESPMPEDVRVVVADTIKQKKSLADGLIARGVPGKGGKGPFLHPVFREAKGRIDADLDSDDIDLREIQQRNTVKAGQLVAEIRYDEQPVPGKTVYGDEVPPPPSDDLIIRVGDGIQQREPGKYYATVDGLPLIDRESLSLSRVLVHEGDVNLRTGNIRFDGPAEIKGSIDAGAVVETTGDLIVHGTIRNAQVSSHGSIAVKSGIVTGDKGFVKARGNIQAEFIENSNITCGGDLTVVKALLTSEVIAGGSVYLTGKDGLIAGGNISCREFVRTDNLGFRNGARTELNIGVDWRVQKAVRLRQVRLANIQKVQQDDRQTLRELVQKSKAQMTQRHAEMKERLQNRLVKARRIAEKLEEQLVRTQTRLSYNEDARIFVKELLVTTVDVTLAGQKITIAHEVAGVALVPKRRRGSHIQPIDEIEAEEKEKVAAAKRAS